MNNDINVWVGDLAEYNSGELYGKWIEFPTDLDTLYNEVLKDGNEEWYIGDYDSIINLEGYSFKQINEIAECIQGMDSLEKEIFVAMHESGFFSDLESLIECMENNDFMTFHDCKNMSDVAYSWYEETGQMAELEKVINPFYIDWELLGRDMDIEGTYLQINNDTFIQLFL